MDDAFTEPLIAKPLAPELENVLRHCFSLDLECLEKSGEIREFAAVRADTGECWHFRKGKLADGLQQLDEFAQQSQAAMQTPYLLGHNLINFDLPHLLMHQPQSRLARWPLIDTLRLNPLAFPRNPYHYLVKHYQDGRLSRGNRNDPELDARLTLELLRDQLQALWALRETAPHLLLIWHWLCGRGKDANGGFEIVFSALRGTSIPTTQQAQHAMASFLQGISCQTAAANIMAEAEANSNTWPLAYLLAWLSLGENSNSVLPAWVQHAFPAVRPMLQRLRNQTCSDPSCAWCQQRHNPQHELNKWFVGYRFRAKPADAEGNSLQQAIVQSCMRGQHVLGILPTGTGKSVCYQVPALSLYDKTGALTVVVSPLVALMADQVRGLEARGITSCASINGLLSMPERADVLERIRLGEIGILIIAPEQLRGQAVRKVLRQREIGMWVLDEAHCVSKWGHDFRPDYRYLGRFIVETAGAGTIPPVLCLTATAKPDVVTDMLAFFETRVGIRLKLLDGGAERTNLSFDVLSTTQAEKKRHIHQLLQANLPNLESGGAIVYCASRRQTEEVAEFLAEQKWQVDFFHAGLPPERKKNVQADFIDNRLQVITATNAFGMGIDKPNVRLVIHAEMPGSLENYLQEAGRAGRDQAQARCVLLHTLEDVEWQFGMSARSRLSRREISAILKALRNLERRDRGQSEEKGLVVATTGELLVEDVDGQFQRDSHTDDTRVRTALAWLEEAQLLRREENRVQVFPSSLRVASIQDAEQKLDKNKLQPLYRQQLVSIVHSLFYADPTDGISTDELMQASGLTSTQVRSALYDMQQLGLVSNDSSISMYLHVAVEHSSKKRLQAASELEQALIALLREKAPDLGKGEQSLLHLRLACQELKDAGHSSALPDKLWRILHSISFDGRTDDGGQGSVRLKRLDAESVQVTLQREWSALEKTAQLRRSAADVLLNYCLQALPAGTRGVDQLLVTTQGKLLESLLADVEIQAEGRNCGKLLDRALLWLHEQDVLRLNKGMAVFRPAMTIQLEVGKGKFEKEDFAPLQLHYEQQVAQIHVMATYVQRGLEKIQQAQALVRDYFSLAQEEFMRRWLPQQDTQLQTTPESWNKIVESLNNARQKKIVADEREASNVLVLAAPGSGKTRVLVHRIAYLLRVKRENPHAILALAYNRHAAVEIRRRLYDLLGDDARGVLIMTCHALAMRLVGASLIGKHIQQDENGLSNLMQQVMQQAIALLKGQGLPPEEADEQRQRLLGNFRWILVDEYQDIGEEQYELISALAGRTRSEEDGRLSLFAVGDDDQNIYAFDGASVEFIRKFEEDYRAKTQYLLENYRSTQNIITAANALIAAAQQRMKAEQIIVCNRERRKEPAGGVWQERDSLAKGRVQILPVGGDIFQQCETVMGELRRLAALDPAWDWRKVAIIARQWKFLQPFKAYCHLHQIEVQMADNEGLPIWRLRETQLLMAWLQNSRKNQLDTRLLINWLAVAGQERSGPWWDLLREAAQEYALEFGLTSEAEKPTEPNAADALANLTPDDEIHLPREHFIEWLVEWGREVRRSQRGLLLTTAHRAKGLEFDHVAVLDGDWAGLSKQDDVDAPRRLYYVAMTRARQTLLLAKMHSRHALLDALSHKTLPDEVCWRRSAVLLEQSRPDPRLQQHYQRLDLKQIDLGFAGRRHERDVLHQQLASLQVGDALQLRYAADKKKWQLRNAKGEHIGNLSQLFQMPAGMHCVQAQVAAILVWRFEDAPEEFQARLNCKRWEVVVPELVLAPVA